MGDPDTEIRIESAFWQGRPVLFAVSGFPAAAGFSYVDRGFVGYAAMGLFVLLAAALLLIWHRARGNRLDWRGGFALAGLFFVLGILGGVLDSYFMSAGASIDVLTVVAVWLFYISIEPLVRRHWPDSLISWTRLTRVHTQSARRFPHSGRCASCLDIRTLRSGRLIDMHLHAVELDVTLPVAMPNPVTGEPAPSSGLEQIQEAIELMERYNIVKAVVSGSVEAVAAWRDAAPERVLGSLAMGRPGLNSGGEPLPPIDALRALYADGALAAMGELTAQYEGYSPSDSGYEPYFALAEELDVPVGVHTGTSFPGTAYRGKPNFRVSLGNPILLEDVLVRHPNLRVYLMHGGHPWDREAQAIMQQYPQVYIDISPLWLAAASPDTHRLAEESLLELFAMGVGERIMFGTDQMAWPEAVGMAIEMIESSRRLSEAQKRDILYNNAARFLGLSDEEIARHHGR